MAQLGTYLWNDPRIWGDIPIDVTPNQNIGVSSVSPAYGWHRVTDRLKKLVLETRTDAHNQNCAVIGQLSLKISDNRNLHGIELRSSL